MIRVTVFKDSYDKIHGIAMKGHAGYAEAGEDIVCAAVSALVFNAYNSVEAFTEDEFKSSMDEKSGDFQFRLAEPVSAESELLMASLLLGLENIKESYGEQYIKIRFEEV